MKYRKKPIIIEAEQWFPGKKIEGVGNVEGGKGPDFAFVNTLEGIMTVKPGDYIITGFKGEKYPCKPDIFEATYEKVEPE